jgi:hypothetical protein
MGKLKHFLQTKPVFLYLLPVFFVLHGYTENYSLVPVSDALLLNAKYLAISLFFSLFFWLLYRNFTKANLVAFFIMAYNFFFGSAHDFLKKIADNTFIVRYSFIIPATAILLVILVLYIKKTRSTFINTAKYLNILLLLLILLDTVNLLLKIPEKRESRVVEFPGTSIKCDTCTNPDIYLIIADEYAGKKELQDIFSFDNAAFESDLTHRGFHIINNPKSNYNGTLYSMASLLNMGYNQNLSSSILNNKDMFLCAALLKNNSVVQFLKGIGYEIHNYSFFDFNNYPKLTTTIFYPTRQAIITAQTFTSRAYKNLWLNFTTQSKIQDILNRNLYNNIKTDSITRQAVSSKGSAPKFIYTHLIMPHPPYYFDSSGQKQSDKSLYDEYKSEKKAYLAYLKYSNKKLLELIDYIKANSKKPPVIILMSDHGFRQFKENEKVDSNYYFMTINTIFLPNGNYSGFYDGMSNVNQFRVILNSQFGQKLPLLKDSTSFLSEKVN